MEYNFDKIIERKNTDSVKWNDTNIGELLPMWVADMDFQSPPEVIKDLEDRVKHGIYGYFILEDGFYDSIISWVSRRHKWEIKKEWIVINPGVVTGLNIAVDEFVEEDDNVIVQPPIYPPFYQVIEENKRNYIENFLSLENGEYRIDFDDLSNKAKDGKMLIFCNPHNPTGRVWNKEELSKLAKVCEDHNVMIVSDEIHSDLIIGDNKHIPIANLSEKIANNSITFISPSKTFNLAGLKTAVAIIPNKEIRDRYIKNMKTKRIPETNIFGKVALESAYNKGEKWLDGLLVYLEENMDFVIDYVKKNIPEIKVNKPEGMYLMWLDFSSLDKDHDEIKKALLEVGEIYLNDGKTYGPGGDKHFRINVGCPRQTVEEGLKRIEKAIAYLR